MKTGKPIKPTKSSQLLSKTADFFFYFNENNQLSKVRLDQENLGGIDFYALTPVQERLFSDKDFLIEDCEMIPSIILEEAKTFVTFMQSMVEELIGNEDVMIAIARATGNYDEEENSISEGGNSVENTSHS